MLSTPHCNMPPGSCNMFRLYRNLAIFDFVLCISNGHAASLGKMVNFYKVGVKCGLLSRIYLFWSSHADSSLNKEKGLRPSLMHF